MSEQTATDAGRRAGRDHRHADRARLPVHARAGRVAVPAGHRAGQDPRPALPELRKVYVPPRGACATCGVATDEEVELTDKGTVTTFCVVNVPFYGQTIKIPYVSATILLDGADIGLMHLIQEVRGRRRAHGHAGRGGVVRPAERKPTLESIRALPAHRRARRRLRHLQGLRLMRDVAVVSFAQSASVRGRGDAQRGRDPHAGRAGGDRALGHRAQGDRLHHVGQLRLPRGRAVRVRLRPRRGRRLAADP